jgi:endonuclease/exonuclease/phosphatase family metal-dependent hydrolase
MAVAAALVLSACGGDEVSSNQPVNLRVATYNIEWFGEDANPARVKNLKAVMDAVQPNVIGLQEIQSEAALRQIFDDEWEIFMTDDPAEAQELAFAVRKPYKVVDHKMVFPEKHFDYAFPRGRDALQVVVEAPNGVLISMYVVHAKSRGGGRMNTDPRREGAAALLAAYVSADPHDHKIVLGDFNDAPDDRSVNILESGDLLVEAGDNSIGRLLVNLTQPLHEEDYVTLGMNDLFEGEAIEPIAKGAKEDNARLRGIEYRYPDDVKVMQALFDQILASPGLAGMSDGRAEIFSGNAALGGTEGDVSLTATTVEYTEKGTLASDHLPVFADFVLS